VAGVEQHVGHVESTEKGEPEYGQWPGVGTAAKAELRAGTDRLTAGTAFGVADLHGVILQVFGVALEPLPVQEQRPYHKAKPTGQKQNKQKQIQKTGLGLYNNEHIVKKLPL
jgi:hypothetical protein